MGITSETIKEDSETITTMALPEASPKIHRNTREKGKAKENTSEEKEKVEEKEKTIVVKERKQRKMRTCARYCQGSTAVPLAVPHKS